MTESGALPYSIFLILLQLGAGGVLVMHAVHLRRQATPGFVRATTIMIPVVMGLALWTAVTLDGDVVQGFAIEAGARAPLIVLVAILTGASILHNAALYSGRERLAMQLGWIGSGLALGCLAITSVTLAGAPTWLLSLTMLTGALALGLSAVGLALGHWYLVTPRLPARPLVEVTTAFLIVVALQAVFFTVALAISVETPLGGRDLALTSDPTFWLRIVIGFGLALIFGWMAWSTARMRSMMAATGLLYLTTAAVLAAQIAAAALMFDSGRPL